MPHGKESHKTKRSLKERLLGKRQTTQGAGERTLNREQKRQLEQADREETKRFAPKRERGSRR